jgi:hypothetical protein
LVIIFARALPTLSNDSLVEILVKIIFKGSFDKKIFAFLIASSIQKGAVKIDLSQFAPTLKGDVKNHFFLALRMSAL